MDFFSSSRKLYWKTEYLNFISVRLNDPQEWFDEYPERVHLYIRNAKDDFFRLYKRIKMIEKLKKKISC